MANELKSTIRNCIHSTDANRRYARPEEVAEYLNYDLVEVRE